MDQEERNVFYSSEQILSYNDHIDDKFSDLITITPAEPSCSRRVPVENDSSPSVTRLPRNIEFRKRSTMKVKTVGEIRRAFDEHIHEYLPAKLEKIEKYFFKRIRQGASENIETKCTARNVLNNEDPISRAAWRMIIRLNVDDNLCDTQYIKWNKRKIRLNGSKGGQVSVLRMYDNFQKVSEELGSFESNEVKPNIPKKYGLLQQSLNVAFKPGPLSKKTKLDDSFQKNNIGKAVLVHLPEVGLEIKPKLGVPFEPVVYNLIQEKRSRLETIDEEWANFSVAAVAKVDERKNIAFETSPQLFKIPFKNNQNRIVMRKDYENKIYSAPCERNEKYSNENVALGQIEAGEVAQDVRDVLNGLVRAVEISTSEESFFSQETDFSKPIQNVTTPGKDKIKLKKKYTNELARLAITVIQVNSGEWIDNAACSQTFCKLGCICSSLDYQFQLNNHCGKVDCMFDCKCLFKSCKTSGDPYSFIPGIINIKNKVTSKLAKEERKFHQTVVFSKDEPILLGSKRRFTRAPKRYAEFVSLQGKEENKLQQIPKVVLSRMAIHNVAPWCMIHQLYRCFCKNKYSESLFSYPLTYNGTPTEDAWSEMPVISEPRMSHYKGSPVKKEIRHHHKRLIHIEPKNVRQPSEISSRLTENARDTVKKPIALENEKRHFNFTMNCARTLPIDFVTKRPKSHYYNERNERIKQLECKDKRLQMLLERHSGISENTQEPFMMINNRKLESEEDIELKSLSQKQLEQGKQCFGMPADAQISPLSKLASQVSQPNCFETEHKWIATSLKRGRHSQPKLNCVKGPRFIKWLEKNYINIKSRPGRSLNLGEPRNNKVSLYPWVAFQRRYIEKKNVFLVSITPPFRLFLTLATNIDTLKDCISIDSLNRGQLEEYPLIISDLLLNVDIEDCFVILNGRTQYWEAVGTVIKKINTPSHVEQTSDRESDVSVDFSNNNSDNSLLTPIYETRLVNADIMVPISKKCEVKPFLQQKQDSTLQPTSSKDDVQKGKIAQSRPKKKKYTNANTCVETEKNMKKAFVAHHEGKKENEDNAIKFPDNSEPSSTEQSRWFVLTVESDFSEIRFYNEGFFVKQANIMKAISLAQDSGETVALPNQSVYELNGTIQPKFGIYAIPMMSKNCVLLGPYDMDQVLGIETLCYNRITEHKTRGNWIYTNKANNLKVIEHPVDFILKSDGPEIVINPFVADSDTDNQITKQQFINVKDFLAKEMSSVNKLDTQDLTFCNKNKSLCATAIKKTFVFESKLKPGILQHLKKLSPKKIEQVRPITIKKDNGFYRVANQLFNKSVSILKQPNVFNVVTKPKIVTRVTRLDKDLQQDGTKSESLLREKLIEPSCVNTENKPQFGVYILKPKQINDIINQNTLESAKTDHTYSFGNLVQQDEPNMCETTDKSKNESKLLQSTVDTSNEYNDSIRNSLDSSDQHNIATVQNSEFKQKCKETELIEDFSSNQHKQKPSSEVAQREANVVCISSDDEGEGGERDVKKMIGEKKTDEETKNVRTKTDKATIECVETEEDQRACDSWIVCRNVKPLGFIKSRKKDNLISFQFPGFKASEYNTPAAAFDKINQLLARKVFVPPGTQLEWEVITNKDEVVNMEMLNIKYLKAEYILTKNGLRHSRKLITQHTDEIKAAVALLGQSLLSPEQLAKTEHWKLITMAPKAIASLKEEESNLLKQKKLLRKELRLKRAKYSQLIQSSAEESTRSTEVDIDTFIQDAVTVAPHGD